MKILQIMAGAKHGGAETAFVDMCVAMHESGETIEVITRANDVRVPILEKAGITVHTAPFGGPVDVYTPWRIGKIIAEFQPLIVQTWMARASRKTPNWQKTKTSQPYLVTARLGGYYKVKNFKSADYFTTNTPELKTYLMDGGIEENRIRFIQNFAEVEEDTAPVRRADLDTPKEATVLVTLARLHENKALDVLLKTMPDLPGVYLWIAGEGPAREELEKLAKDLGISERVRFLGWRTDRSALLQAADLCVFPSRKEPFGTVFVQAWAAKTPVIVSDAAGPKQFCKNGEDSLMVPRDNVEALREAIQKLMGDKVLQMNLVKRGYQRFRDEFTKEKAVSAYMEFYVDILKWEKLL